MKHRALGAALAVVVGLALTHPIYGQEYDEAAVMAAYEKAMTPAAPHARLAKMAGEWQLEVKFWMQPGGEPTVSTATNTRKMIMGGRYLTEHVEGDAMGQPFTGMGLTAYNNVEERFEAIWVDNMGTGIFTSHGEWNEAENALIMHGSYVDPATGKKKEVKTISRMEGPDKEVFEQYEKSEGEDEAVKTMEIVSIRK
ncbi:MAG: DUF1579 domain-containing protein [Gemmatimonadota bacterium]